MGGSVDEEMDLVRRRLRRLLPAVRISAQGDARTTGSNSDDDRVEAHAHAKAVLIFCTPGFTASADCLRALRYAAATGTPLIPLLDDPVTGGLPQEEVKAQVAAAGDGRMAGEPGVDQEDKALRAGGDGDGGEGAALAAALFPSGVEPLEWSDDPHLQDVTIRLIAQRLLPEGTGATYAEGEGASLRAALGSHAVEALATAHTSQRALCLLYTSPSPRDS